MPVISVIILKSRAMAGATGKAPRFVREGVVLLVFVTFQWVFRYIYSV